MSALEWAAVYASHNLHVIPVEPRGKKPSIDNWQNSGSVDPARISAWFLGADRNVGIVCGPSEIVVVDVDPRNGGSETLALLVAEFGELPPTVTADTGGAGEHFVFRRPSGDLVGKLGSGVDLLHDGRQILVQPSVHPSGNPYRWRSGLAPDEVAIAELPPAWIDRVRRKLAEPAPRREPPTGVNHERQAKRARAYLSKLPPAIQGSRGSDALWAATCWTMHGFDLDDASVRHLIVEDYNPRCDPPWSDREIDHKIEDARRAADRNRWRVEDREQTHVERFGLSIVDGKPGSVPEKPVRAWRRCRDLVDAILEHANDPTVKLMLGGDEICELRAGSTVLLIGGTGRGKTSMAASLLVEHAARGPAIAMSLELPADEWTARAIGLERDAGWMDVLQGRVSRDGMLSALPERLAIVDRDAATLEALTQAIDDLRAEYPNEPILCAVDYVQIAAMDGDAETRTKVAHVMRALDKIARSRRVVIIALSQGSRVSARSLATGEKLGAETVDTGAESAALEQWSSLVIAIGQLGELSPDGTRPADISIGKGRMNPLGDTVRPGRFNGRTGLWRLSGDAKPAADVRAARATERDRATIDAARLVIVAALEKSSESLTREDLRTLAARKAPIVRAAVVELLDGGEIVEVRQKKKRARDWQLWTRARAEAAGVGIVEAAA